MEQELIEWNRRRFLSALSAMGFAPTLLPDALTVVAGRAETITIEMLSAAQQLAGISFTQTELEAIAARLNAATGYAAGYDALRAAKLGNDTPFALVFNPIIPGTNVPQGESHLRPSSISIKRPDTDEALAFLPVTHLAHLIQSRQISSRELTELYLARLARYDAVLHCVVSLTPEIAREEASAADAEIAAGRYRGPLHGIPYGLKDLFSVRGTTTGWGASPYRAQRLDVDATVYTRLRVAGAVLVAKLSAGALALGAQWYGGLTRNPWNIAQDAAGSSAGPGSATAAALVGFSVGTDTGGSILSPAARNGVTGLRSSFGRVSRHGAMALAWTQDVVGPMCRSAEDCAIVLSVIHGRDDHDNSLLDIPFQWDTSRSVRSLKVGYLRDAVGEGTDVTSLSQLERVTRQNNAAALGVIRELGVKVEPMELPRVPVEAIDFIRYAETAAAFDEITRDNRLREIEDGPERSRRPAEIRAARFIPAVEYVQANRFRTRVMQQMHDTMKDIDVVLGADTRITNRTGHPVVSIPSGFFNGSPTGLSMTGKLFGDAEVLLLARAFQEQTTHHSQRPSLP
jgi:Asp-tRNA(Asn)/Glu-tRNA(Gln) amidotransferase A subunit family amidase